MKIFDYFRRSEPPALDRFASSLVEDIYQRYPPELDTRSDKRPSVNRLTRIIEDACNKAAEYKQSQDLGWIARSRLANKFKWGLKEKGYSDQFVDFATEAIIVYLSK